MTRTSQPPSNTRISVGPRRTADPAVQQMLQKAERDGTETVFDRVHKVKPCTVGASGACCRVCGMGPCRVTKPGMRGVCGATPETIAARGFARMIAAGTAAHSDHAREVVRLFKDVAAGTTEHFDLKEHAKLLAVASDLGIAIENRPIREIAYELGKTLEAMFGAPTEELPTALRAPEKTLMRWRQAGTMPRGIDREVVELMHRTHMGVDQDYRSLLRASARCALADGWGGSMIATDLQDILFGTPRPTLGNVNLGVLRQDAVNIVIHGHDPALAEMLALASREPQATEAARTVGASCVNLVGMCCTGGEVLLRHGIPHGGNFLMQELAIVTGAVEAMVLDVQCEMQALGEVARCYHTRLVTTSSKARIEGVEHVPFEPREGLAVARSIVKKAVANFPNRRRVEIPPHSSPALVGFSAEAIADRLGGSLKPLADAIVAGQIRGVAGVVGCNNARVAHDSGHLRVVRELIRNDVLVLSTGCAAIAFARAGLLTPEASHLAGPGLRSICGALQIPPILHVGACVDNSRILLIATRLMRDGQMGQELSDLPLAGAAPEWMSEKALTIGQYFVSSGVFTVFGAGFPTAASGTVGRFLREDSLDLFGARWEWQRSARAIAAAMLEHIDQRRNALGLRRISLAPTSMRITNGTSSLAGSVRRSGTGVERIP